MQCTGAASLYPIRGDRDDDPVIVSQELPDLGNGRGQRSIHDRRARPHRIEELGLGDHLTCVVEQRAKDFERLGLDLHWRALTRSTRPASSSSQSPNRHR